MKVSRSEFLVLREILKSEKGLPFNKLLMALRGRLSPQGLSDALKNLQGKSLIYRDFMTKTKGSHALYKSTATSFDTLFTNDMAEFLVSKEAARTGISLPAPTFATSCLSPSATLVSEAREAFGVLENEDFGTKLWGAAQHIVSVWLEYRQRNYNDHSLKVVKEYEEALARYLWLFECQMKRWAPLAVNDLKKGPYNYVDPLDMIEGTDNIDWPLQKYHITEEELEESHKKFPNSDSELGKLSAEELRKLKAIVYNKKKRQTYEEYLKFLIPPKTVLLLDFRLSAISAKKQITGKIESAENADEEPDIGIPIAGKSAFQEAEEEYGKKEPA